MESTQSVFLRYNLEESRSPLNGSLDWHRNSCSQASVTSDSQPSLFDLQHRYVYGPWSYRHTTTAGGLPLFDSAILYTNQQPSEEENESSLSSQSPQHNSKDESGSLFGDPSVLINKLIDELEDGVSMSPFSDATNHEEINCSIPSGGDAGEFNSSAFEGDGDKFRRDSATQYDVGVVPDHFTEYSQRSCDSNATQQKQSACINCCEAGKTNAQDERFSPVVGVMCNGALNDLEECQSGSSVNNMSYNGSHKQAFSDLRSVPLAAQRSTSNPLRKQEEISQLNIYSSARNANSNVAKERVRRSNRNKSNRSTRVASNNQAAAARPPISLDDLYATEHGMMLKTEEFNPEKIDLDSDEYESDLENLLKQMDRREYQDSWSKDWTLGLIRFCKYMQLSEKMQMGPVMTLPQDESRCVINVKKKIYQIRPPAGWPSCGVRLQIHCGGYLQDILAWSNVNRAMWLLIMPLVEKGISMLIKKVGGVQKLRNGHQPYFNACRNALRENNTLHACLKDYSRTINTSKRKRQFSNGSFKEAANDHECPQPSTLREGASAHENVG